MQDELAHAGTAPAVEGPFSPAWWESRTSDDLKAIVHRGIQGGDTFFAAAAEMERRARAADSVRQAEEAQVIEVDHRHRKIAWGGLLVIPLALAAFMRLIGVW